MWDGVNERIPRPVGKLAKTLVKTLNGVCCHMLVQKASKVNEYNNDSRKRRARNGWRL